MFINIFIAWLIVYWSDNHYNTFYLNYSSDSLEKKIFKEEVCFMRIISALNFIYLLGGGKGYEVFARH